VSKVAFRPQNAEFSRRELSFCTPHATQLNGSISEIVASHRLLTGPRSDGASVARVHDVIRESHTERQATLLVRANGHVYDSCWKQHAVDLEEIVLAYLGYQPGNGTSTTTPLEAVQS
jgi:hypothetical protein